MKKINYIILLITVLSSLFSYGQDGRSLILVHNYADKDAIDAIANPSDGNIAYNATDKSFYLYDEENSKWIADCYYKAITTTVGALPLTEDHYTVIINAPGGAITLPAAGNFNGREYVLKNTTSGTITITDYKDNANLDSDEIPAESILKLQSDGADWNQVNNYLGVSESTATNTSDGSNCLNSNPPVTYTNNTTTSFSNYNYDDFGANVIHNAQFLYFAYTNNTINPSLTGNVTEIQIVLRNVTFEILTPLISSYSGGSIPISNISVSSGEADSGIAFRNDHVITITGINLSINQQLTFNFETNKDGFTQGMGGVCIDCSIEYHTN